MIHNKLIKNMMQKKEQVIRFRSLMVEWDHNYTKANF